jgi:vacuolar-type H+-ATPase subunit D/Vma8
MSQVSFGITLSLRSFHFTGFESIDFRRRFGLDDCTSTYDCKYAQSRTECDEAFARAWFGNATWHSADIGPDWLVPGELIIHEHNRDTVHLVPELSPERAKDLYMRARLAQVECERDEARAGHDTLLRGRDNLILNTSEAIEERNRAVFENEQLKTEVQRLREQVSTHDDRYNDMVAIANRNENINRENEDKFERLYEEYKLECMRADSLAKIAEKQANEIDVLKHSLPAIDVPLQQRYEQLQKDYDNECIKADQRAAQLTEMSARYTELARKYANLVDRIEAADSAIVTETADTPD